MSEQNIICLNKYFKSFLNDNSWCISVSNRYFNKNLNLIDYFPLLKQGYALGKTLNLSFNIYSKLNNLVKDKNIKLNDHIITSFSNIDFIKKEMITIPKNTMYLDELRIFWIVATNLINSSFKDIPKDENFINELTKEFRALETLNNIIDQIHKRVKQHDLGSLMLPICVTLHRILSLSIGEEEAFVDYLIKDKRTELLYSIINNNINSQSDFRDYNYEAWYLALEIGDKQMINLIKNSIIKQTWIEKQVFEITINSLESESDLPKILYAHSRYNF